MSLARATLSGTVLGEPEKRFTPNNVAVTNFTIQVTQQGRNDAPFQVRVTCWKNLADTVAQEVHTGDSVIVEGRLQINQFESQGGVTKRTYEVDANTVFKGQLQSLGSGTPEGAEGNFAPKGNNAPYTPPAQQQPVQQQAPVGVGAPQAQPQQSFIQEDLLTEDDIPF